MKKILFTLGLLISVVALQAQICRVQENNDRQVTLHYTAGQLEVLQVGTPEGDFTRLFMENAHLSSEVGQPQLPVVVSMLEIPLCEAVRCEVVSSHYIDYYAADLGVVSPIFPAQPSYSKSDVGEKDLVPSKYMS